MLVLSQSVINLTFLYLISFLSFNDGSNNSSCVDSYKDVMSALWKPGGLKLRERCWFLKFRGLFTNTHYVVSVLLKTPEGPNICLILRFVFMQKVNDFRL